MAANAGWVVVAGMLLTVLGAFLHWLFARKDCEHCGIAELKAEISRLYNLVESLWEKSGFTVKDRLEIEGIKKG